MLNTDTLNELTDKANNTHGSIRDKEKAFCEYVTSAIIRNYNEEVLSQVWFRTECDSLGHLTGTHLEKWYFLLNEARTAFWQQVENGLITGYLPGSSLPALDY